VFSLNNFEEVVTVRLCRAGIEET